jgi:hypothetical protein
MVNPSNALKGKDETGLSDAVGVAIKSDFYRVVDCLSAYLVRVASWNGCAAHTSEEAHTETEKQKTEEIKSLVELQKLSFRRAGRSMASP